MLMLFGWLIMGGAGVVGKTKSVKRRFAARSRGKKYYVDAYGTTRYTDTDLPYSQIYEDMIKNDRYYEKVRFWQAEYERYIGRGRITQEGIDFYRRHIEEERAAAERTKEFMREIDAAAAARLKKQGYSFRESEDPGG